MPPQKPLPDHHKIILIYQYHFVYWLVALDLKGESFELWMCVALAEFPPLFKTFLWETLNHDIQAMVKRSHDYSFNIAN